MKDVTPDLTKALRHVLNSFDESMADGHYHKLQAHNAKAELDQRTRMLSAAADDVAAAEARGDKRIESINREIDLLSRVVERREGVIADIRRRHATWISETPPLVRLIAELNAILSSADAG